MCANEINCACISSDFVFRAIWVSKFFLWRFSGAKREQFFSSTIIRIFFSNIGNDYFFWKKTYPPPSLKIIGRSLKIKNQKGIKTVLNYLPKTSFGVVRRRDFGSLTISSSLLFNLILLSHKNILHQNCNKDFLIKFFEWDKLLVFFFF